MAIYQGVWFDHNTQKLVLTLDATAAGFLSAALVTWVHLVAACTWSIWRYLFFALGRRKNGPSDVFRRQRQAAIRNSSSSASTAIELIKLAFSWRSYHIGSLRRNIFYLLMSIIVFVAWTICGLYAPYIYSRTGSDVLLAAASTCGYIHPNETISNTYAFSNVWERDAINLMAAADTYVQLCYNTTDSTASSTVECSQYPHQSLPFSNQNTSVCPFGDNCITTNSTPIVLDTGFLDSDTHFGLNTPRWDTVQYRRVATCSPVTLKGFLVVNNVSAGPDAADYLPDTVLVDYNYGPYIYNYTFELNEQEIVIDNMYALETALYQHNYTGDEAIWSPNATFYNGSYADVGMILFQGNKIRYINPVYDPIFHATDALVEPALIGTGNVTLYASDYLARPLACTEQHQFCLGRDPDNCTPLLGAIDIWNHTARLPGLTPRQAAIFSVMGFSLSTSSMFDVTVDLGPSVLLASHSLNGPLQTVDVPSNQWALEATNLFAIALNRMQAIILSHATGPTNALLVPYVQAPTVLEEKVCHLQRVRTPNGSVNFDMLGLIILVVFGAGFMVLGLLFETIMGFISHKLIRKWRARHDDWIATGLFQIQRHALEARGVMNWENTEGTVPKTRDNVDRHSSNIEYKGSPAQSMSLLHMNKGDDHAPQYRG